MALEEVALTANQEKLWGDTKAALWWHCPAFTHILLTMLQNGKHKKEALFTRDPSVPIAATNGTMLMINPDTFFTFELYQRLFILAHEIMHCILNHCILGYQFKMSGKVTYPDGGSLPFDHDTMNIAMDLVINDILVHSDIGEMPSKNGAQVGWHAPDLGNHMESALDVYRKIFNPSGGRKGRDPGGDGVTTGGNRAGGKHGDKSFDKHLEPGTGEGKDPQSAANDRNDGEWKTALAGAVAAAKAMGKMPVGLARVLGEVLEPKVDWREHIQALMARRVGSGSNDWRRPDRRLIVRDIYAPGRSGHGAGTIMVAGDTSGSIGEEELDMFFAEMAGIIEDIRPKLLLIAWCDAALHRVDEAEDASDLNKIRYEGAPGGGGTSFVPVFEWLEKEHIELDALVYLTDGQGTFPAHPPEFPVIWGSILNKPEDYPFGDVVMIPHSTT